MASFPHKVCGPWATTYPLHLLYASHLLCLLAPDKGTRTHIHSHSHTPQRQHKPCAVAKLPPGRVLHPPRASRQQPSKPCPPPPRRDRGGIQACYFTSVYLHKPPTPPSHLHTRPRDSITPQNHARDRESSEPHRHATALAWLGRYRFVTATRRMDQTRHTTTFPSVAVSPGPVLEGNGNNHALQSYHGDGAIVGSACFTGCLLSTGTFLFFVCSFGPAHHCIHVFSAHYLAPQPTLAVASLCFHLSSSPNPNSFSSLFPFLPFHYLCFRAHLSTGHFQETLTQSTSSTLPPDHRHD